MKIIQMTIGEPLLRAIDRASRARKLSRSAYIREALVAELQRDHLRVAEEQHAAGYRAKPPKKGEFDVWYAEQDWSER